MSKPIQTINHVDRIASKTIMGIVAKKKKADGTRITFTYDELRDISFWKQKEDILKYTPREPTGGQEYQSSSFETGELDERIVIIPIAKNSSTPNATEKEPTISDNGFTIGNEGGGYSDYNLDLLYNRIQNFQLALDKDETYQFFPIGEDADIIGVQLSCGTKYIGYDVKFSSFLPPDGTDNNLKLKISYQIPDQSEKSYAIQMIDSSNECGSDYQLSSADIKDESFFNEIVPLQVSELTIGQEGISPTANTTIKFKITENYTAQRGFFGGLTLKDVWVENITDGGIGADPADSSLSYDKGTGEYTYTSGEPYYPDDTYEIQIAILSSNLANPYNGVEEKKFTFVQPAYT